MIFLSLSNMTIFSVKSNLTVIYRKIFLVHEDWTRKISSLSVCEFGSVLNAYPDTCRGILHVADLSYHCSLGNYDKRCCKKFDLKILSKAYHKALSETFPLSGNWGIWLLGISKNLVPAFLLSPGIRPTIEPYQVCEKTLFSPTF